MPPIRSDRHTTRSGPYPAIQPSQWRASPNTPNEFFDKIRAYHKETPALYTRRRTSHAACDKCYNTAIETKRLHNKFEKQIDERTTPMRFLRHSVLQLDELVIACLDVEYEHLTDTQLKAIETLDCMIQDQSEVALLRRLGHPDGQDVEYWEMERLIILFSKIFFQITPWDKMEVLFHWGVSAAYPHLLGSCTGPDFGRRKTKVWMSAYAVTPDPSFRHLNGTTMSRLSTLVHELVHAYICEYACRSCPSYQEDVAQLDGHGRVWQRIAKSVEYFARRVIGLPLDLDRFTAIRHGWRDMQVWPTEEEARGWALKNAHTSTAICAVA
jgi:hypothetical protein